MSDNKYSWKSCVRSVTPYTPGEQPKVDGVIKLNTNESPFPPSPAVKRVLESADAEKLRLYPDINATPLVEALAEKYGVKPSQIFVGVGSDDVLSVAFMTFFCSDKPILFPDITYSFYDVWAALYNIPYKTVPLNAGFELDIKDYMQPNGGIVIANPNAPTGIFKNTEELEEIIKANPSSVVIIDEAYIDFGGTSCIPLTEKYDNLLVVQTFSKSRSLAGLRIGYAIGCSELIRCMNDVKFSINSYTINMLSCLCGAAAAEDEEYFKSRTDEIIRIREYSKDRLKKLGFDLTDSRTNFLFAEHSEMPAKQIFTQLKERNIFVRYWDIPAINNRLRITVGTKEQMDTLFSALERIISDRKA